MTYKLGLAQGFEVDPDGSLSDPANLISAWPLTELAGPRREAQRKEEKGVGYAIPHKPPQVLP